MGNSKEGLCHRANVLDFQQLTSRQ